MTQAKQSQVARIRWFTGSLGLALLIFINLQPVIVPSIIWLAANHGHEHQIAFHSDGNHLDVRLAHPKTQTTADHHHAPLLPLVAALFSTHAHDGTEHVLHFTSGDVPDQIKSAVVIPPSHPQQDALPSTCFITTASASETAAPESAARPPPPLTAGLLCLRTTVLLI